MWASIAQITGVAVSVLTLGFAVVTQVRQSSQRKYAERAETAARLLATLQMIDVGGISPKLDGSLALKVHAEQVHGLQEVIRLNIAEFEARAKRAGFSLALHFLICIYGILLIVIAFGAADQIGQVQTDQRWVGALIVVAIFILGCGMILDFTIVAAKRVKAREARRKAGIYVSSSLEVLSKLYVTFILWRQRRRDGPRPPRVKDAS
jgi:uncharacterized membrane protein YhaH (DUF805 family)